MNVAPDSGCALHGDASQMLAFALTYLLHDGGDDAIGECILRSCPQTVLLLLLMDGSRFVPLAIFCAADPNRAPLSCCPPLGIGMQHAHGRSLLQNGLFELAGG